MDNKQIKVSEKGVCDEKKSPSTSESDYELVCEDPDEIQKIEPVLCETNVSEELINDAIGSASANTASANNMMVGKSIFYDCNDNNDRTISETDDEDVANFEIEGEGNFTIFSNVVYLGSANLNVPKSEAEILRHINELNTSTSDSYGVKIKISIPNSSDGQIVLYDEDSDALYSTFDIQSILFYARGAKDSTDQACFAFSWSHGDKIETAVYQCHIFRCNIPEAVNRVSQCFAKAFQRFPASMACSITSENNFAMNSITTDVLGNPLTAAVYEFLVALEIREKEKVSKNTYSNVLREKSCFKIRLNGCDKEICITVKQVASDHLPPLFIERCFGVLLSVGKIKKQADMLLLELSTPGAYLKTSADFQIIAKWDVADKAFEALNESSQRTHLITVAVDLVIKGIQEPVRFVIETHMKIDLAEIPSSRFSNNFLFQQGSKRPLTRKFYIQLKENGDNTWILASVDPSDESFDQQSNSFNQKFKSFSKIVRSGSISADFDDLSPDEITETDLDEDEPLASGTGEVNKDCSKDRLDSWSMVLIEWTTTNKRPKNLTSLVRSEGIPETMRCQFWQKLAKIDDRPELADDYRILITKESKCEDVILRDVYRTFPAHEKFRENGGGGQDALYKVSRAYSVYDTEIGYCQGLSFIAATLLLHMPEEEAYQVLVAIMYDYGLRELYKQNFENLSLRLFQLTCMLRDQMPDLYEHFTQQKLEVHMFASQWFLTLFTARFPLPFVFQCIDLFLLDGINVIFQIAFTLLSVCKKDLLIKDFESILKYIRVQLPKKVRSESQAAKLIKLASECKTKKLKKYEDEYLIQKEDNERIERMLQQYQVKYNEDRKILRSEIVLLQQRVKKHESDEKKYESIIQDYKQIIQRQEQQIDFLRNVKPHDNKDVPTCDNDDLNTLKQRIRELELDLARAKVAQCEAECQNQNLKHQLTQVSSTNVTTNLPRQNSSSTNWKTKFIDSLSMVNNAVQNTQIPNMPSMNIPSFQSHITELTTQLTGAELNELK